MRRHALATLAFTLAAALPLAGQFADALQHTGQLTMMRRLAGAPIKVENYFVAAIVAGQVGLDQPPPRQEFS